MSRPAASSAVEEGGSRERRRLALAGAAVFLVAVALYLPALQHEFVWDDLSILMTNAALDDWSKLGDNLAPGFFHEPGGDRLRDYWRPAVVLSHMVDRTLFGRASRGPHLVNALLHAAASLAVLLLGHVWSGSVRRALLAGLLFAVHPVHVETAAWVSGRSDLLLGLFLALALWADGRHGRTGRARWQMGSLVFFVLALLSKEAAVVFPVLIAACGLLLAPGRRRVPPGGLAKALAPAGVALAVLLLVLGIRFGLLAAAAPAGVPETVDRTSLFWTWWSALLTYLQLLCWPAGLTILHRVELAHAFWTPRVLGGLLVFAGLLWAGWRTRRRAPDAAFGIAVLLVGLAPLSNFLVAVSRQGGAEFAVAERFLYAPSIGFCLFAAWTLAVWAPEALRRVAGPGSGGGGEEPAARRDRRGWPELAAGALVLVVLTALAARSWVRIGDWSSDLTLFGAAVEESPGSYLAHLNYAAARAAEAATAADPAARRAGLETARRHYLTAVGLAPGNHRVHYDLANLHRTLGEAAAAEASYRRALELEPALHQARINLGSLLAQNGDLEGALAQFAAADRLAPGLTAAKVNRAHVLQMLGRPREAIPLYEEALAVDPDLFAARDGLRRAKEATLPVGGE